MKKGEKRKQELLQIAYRLFLARGYENTSVDEIIDEAGIAKGTYYYYFESKEQMLEEVIGLMIGQETGAARQILVSDLSVPEKIVGIIASLRPSREETTIKEALHQPQNLLMHEKTLKKLIDTVVPLLAETAEEGIRQGIFCCDHVQERVRMLMTISNQLFNDGHYTEGDITVFIDLMEKMLGAAPGTMEFIRTLIQ